MRKQRKNKMQTERSGGPTSFTTGLSSITVKSLLLLTVSVWSRLVKILKVIVFLKSGSFCQRWPKDKLSYVIIQQVSGKSTLHIWL